MHRIPPADPALTAAASAAAARGWHVFPLLPNDKRPAVRDWQNRATAELFRIEKCWAAGAYGIGIACGPSKLVVVDLDVAKTGQQPPSEWQMPGIGCGEDVLAVLADRADASFSSVLDTYAVRTGSGGLHLYFRASETAELRNTAGQLGWLIDTRAAGGYIVGAGSIVRGRRYELLNDREPAPLPGWIAGRLTAPSPAATAHSAWELLRRGADTRTRYANAALTAEVQRVLEAGEGTRNDTLVRAAFALGQLVGGGVLPDDLVTDALTAAGQAIGLPMRECTATIASGLRSGRARPRGGAA